MSGLAAVLSGKVTPGLYRWHGAFDTPEVQHTVEHAGWHFAWVDGWRGETKQEFLEAVGKAKPNTFKGGQFIKTVTISSSMSPSVKIAATEFSKY